MNGKDGNGKANEARIEFLKQKLEENRAALAAEMVKVAKREKRLGEKEQSIIGAAVVKAAAAFPDFRLMIAQTALSNVTNEKERALLTLRGWLEGR